MERIVLLDAATLPVSIPAPDFPHDWTAYDVTHESEVFERLEKATVAISNKVVLDRETLVRLPNLKLVAVAATGVDHIDTVACKELGIAVANARSYGSGSVAEHALSLLFAVRRGIVTHDRAVRNGDWSRSKSFFLQASPIRDLASSTLGVIGYGSIGRTITTLARGLGMNVVVAERKGDRPRPGRLAFEEVLETSDALTLHMPLVPETEKLIDARAFERMPKDAVLINTARGGLVDTPALIDALRSGKLGGAGIDTLAIEPPPADDPILTLHREGTTNLVVTPHVAWASHGAMTTLVAQVVENMEAFVRGEALRRVV